MVCDLLIETGGLGVSHLRLTATTFSTRTDAGSFYAGSVEASRSAESGVHRPFETVEAATGPWQEGTIFVGDVFQAADYTVRLIVLDGNLYLQIDLILSGPGVPATYDADDELPAAVRLVAENALTRLSS